MTLGRLWGITIVIHPSWLLVFGLVSWSLASGYFPRVSPDFSPLTTWIVAIVTSLAFFGSILVHELAHARVAMRAGMTIRSITLFVFGGVARIEGEPSSARLELRIALAGPVTSVALAAGFGLAALVTRDLRILAEPLAYLARINAMVAIFNLVPGFPLDGGRVLRAFVWAATGSYERATRVASMLGHVLGTLFVVAGLLTMIRGGVVNGLWLALIGWFLQNAAASAGSRATLAQTLGDVRVSQAMSRDCIRVDRDTKLDRLVDDHVLRTGVRCFVVDDAGVLGGLLTLHDIKAIPRERWPSATVGDVLVPVSRLATVRPDDGLVPAMEKLDDARVGQMPVVDDGRLVGMLRRDDILHYIRTRAELAG